MKTIFRNEAINIYLNEDVEDVSKLLEVAQDKGLTIFSSSTGKWDSLYWNNDEKAIAGCERVLQHLPSRYKVSYEEFLQEIKKPRKRIKNES